MSAVKPTAEDYEKAIQELQRDTFDIADGPTIFRWLGHVNEKAASLASHRQSESARCESCNSTGDLIRADGEYLGPCSLPACRADRLAELAERCSLNEESTLEAATALRAYAKLLRGEK